MGRHRAITTGGRCSSGTNLRGSTFGPAFVDEYVQGETKIAPTLMHDRGTDDGARKGLESEKGCFRGNGSHNRGVQSLG